jgi:hypothetical protein
MKAPGPEDLQEHAKAEDPRPSSECIEASKLKRKMGCGRVLPGWMIFRKSYIPTIGLSG